MTRRHEDSGLPVWLSPDAAADGEQIVRESIDLTPELARELLDTVEDLDDRNRYRGGLVVADGRTRVGARVRYLAELIERGRFHGADQEPLIIGWDNRLYGGIARCQAVLLTGRTVKIEVARNVPPGRVLQENDTTVKPRTVADLLESWHKVPRNLCGPLSRAARRALYLHWVNEHWGERGAPRLRPILPGDVLQYLDSWGIEESIELAKMCEDAQGQWGAETRVLLAPLFVANHPDGADGNDVAKDFLRGFVSQVGLYEGDPRILLINYYKDRQSPRAVWDYGLEGQERWIKTCWNMFMTGTRQKNVPRAWRERGVPEPSPITPVSEFNPDADRSA